MQYRIIGSTVPAVECVLNNGEEMYTQSGGMSWQSDGIKMSTNAKGGALKSLGRMFSGESIFMNTYQALRDNCTIAFASTVPGTIMPYTVSNDKRLTVQKGSFLCAQPSVVLSTKFNKKVGAGFFGGEGFILQEMSGSGIVFLEIDGDVVEKDLAAGEVIKVDTGNVVAFENTVSYDIETIKGVGNVLFGGEGLFLTKLTGPGKIILQTMNFPSFAGRIASYVPSK